jgi:hypothetical protein
VCEPRLLQDPAFARRALALLGHVTGDLARSPLRGRREPAVRTLRQALGYGWSVAVAALPGEGLAAFTSLENDPGPGRGMDRAEDRKKSRLKRLLEP